MKVKMIAILYMAFITCAYAQINNLEKYENKESKSIRTFIRFGMGLTSKDLNFGGAFFVPFTGKFIIGLRTNINLEIENSFLEKQPKENLLDIELSLRHTSFLNDNFVIFAGIGAGYSKGKKRGKYLGNPNPFLPVEEYETIEFKSISALAELEVGFFATKSLGISLTGYSILTKERTIFGYQIGIFLYGLSTK